MIESKWFDEVAKKLNDVLPPALSNFKEESERNFKVILQAALAKLDLVAREEFDIQCQLLAKTREQVTQLEQLIKEIEAQRQK